MKPRRGTLDWAGLMADRSGHAGSELCAALGLVREAIQIWDGDSRLVLANPASETIFGHAGANRQPHADIYGNCRQENGSPFKPEDLPVARVIESGQPIDNLLLMSRTIDDKTRWLRVSGRPIPAGPHHAPGAIVTATDITDFIEHRQHLEHLASYDVLTQLPNRILLAERIQISLARARRSGDMVAVCMLDLDGFKPVNDTLGHKAGDELLREVAIRLQESIRGDDTVARVGGDEFALLLCGIRKVSECEQSLNRILLRVGQPYQIAGQAVRIGASAGVALFPGDGQDPDLLLRHADTALYQAKKAGKNQFHFFDRKLDMRLQANRGLLRKIGKAIEEDQFALNFQPIVNCRSGEVEGVEALIRWRHPVLGTLAPAEFLPLIEQDDLGIAIDEWVTNESLRQITAWHDAGIDLDVSVNILSRHLHQPDFAERLALLIGRHPEQIRSRLRIEISESTVMADVNVAAEALHKCHALGMGITLDNFGIGYASLQHLKRLTADTLKIDQSIIRNMLEDPNDLAIVAGVVGFATPFGCRVVAEGAETIEHLLTLLELGCDVIQGYSLAHPMPADKLVAWLRNFQSDPLWRLASTQRPTRDHFELLLAEANHRAWTSHAINQCRQNIENLPDDHHCPFGAWLRKPATQHLRKHEEFRQIERLHHGIHQIASLIGADYRAGDLEGARAKETRLLEEHLRLLSLLKNLRGRLNRDARRKAFQNPEGD